MSLEDRILDLVDRPCHGPGCRETLREDGPSEDFCSDGCQRKWRAVQVGAELDARSSPVIPDGLPEQLSPHASWASREFRPLPMQVMSLQAFVDSSACAALPHVAELDEVSASAAGGAFRVSCQEAVPWGFDPKAVPHGLVCIRDEAWPLFNASVKSKVMKKKTSWWRREWRAVARYFRGE